MIENLETRRFLSASVANGVLTITGTDHADRINVVQRGSAIIVHEGKSVSRFGKKDHISQIVVNALGGNDRVTITSKLNAAVDGGEGKDLIIGGAGSDMLIGGNGNDRILGQRGNDSIAGGVGRDVLFGGAGDDTIEAFDTEADQVAGGAGNDSARVDLELDTAWNIENYLTVTIIDNGGLVLGSTGTMRIISVNSIPDLTKMGAGTLTLGGSATLGGSGSIAGVTNLSSAAHLSPHIGVEGVNFGTVNLSASATGLTIFAGDLSAARASGIIDSGLHAGAKTQLALYRDGVLRPIRVGDLNLDGTVTINDFIDLASNFNANQQISWQEPAVNQDNNVAISDFIDLASNFSGSYSGGTNASSNADVQLLASFDATSADAPAAGQTSQSIEEAAPTDAPVTELVAEEATASDPAVESI